MSESYEELSYSERVAIVSKFIERAPPGEVNDVVNDVKIIFDDPENVDSVVRPALERFNHARATVIDVPGQSYKTVVATAARLPGDKPRYFDPRSGQSFEFDHVKLAATSFEAVNVPEATTSYLASLQTSLDTYISNHFTAGAGIVFPSLVAAPAPPPPSAPAVAATPASAHAADNDNILAPMENPHATLPTKVDTVLAAALVETADDIAAVAHEVEKELKLERADGETEEKKPVDIDEVQPTSPVDEKLALRGEEEMEAEADELAEEGGVAKEADDKMDVEEGAPGPRESQEAIRDLEEEVEELVKDTKEEPAATIAAADDDEKPAAAPAEPAAVVAEEKEDVEEAAAPPAPAAFEADEGKYAIVISGHKYAPQNFWTGQWLSTYSLDTVENTLTASIAVIVHYYEQGNVQLRTTQTTTLPVASPSTPSAIIECLATLEREAQEGINDRLEQLGSRAFRSLRRALPITRQKMDWDKISGYKIGSALTAGGAGARGAERGEVEAEL